MKSVRIEYSTWSRFPGGDIARLMTVMQLPDDLAAQVVEAGSCEQPAGLPEAICSALESQAMMHDVHFDFILSAVETIDRDAEELFETAQEMIMRVARVDVALCDGCEHHPEGERRCNELSAQGCSTNCDGCPANDGLGCRVCAEPQSFGLGFVWDGKKPMEVSLDDEEPEA